MESSMSVCNCVAGNHTIQLPLPIFSIKSFNRGTAKFILAVRQNTVRQFPLDLTENLMFPSVDWMALTLTTSLKALCLGHRVLQELLCKFSDPCSKLLKACWAFGCIMLSIFGSSSIQTFGSRGGEWRSFLGNGVSGLDSTFICGWSFLHLGFEMRRCCRIYTLPVNKYFIKLGIDIWHWKKNPKTCTWLEWQKHLLI